MNTGNFTPAQRFIITLMSLAIVIILPMLAGFVITSVQSWHSSSHTPSQPALDPIPVPEMTTPSPTEPVAFPTSSPTAEPGLWSQVQAARLFDQIAYQVEIARGLSPRAEVPLSFHQEQDMEALLTRFQGEQEWLFPYTELEILPRAYTPTLRVPHTVAFYAPEQRQLYVSTGAREGHMDDQSLLAHAYIHALQDQYFNLGALDARAKTTDARLATQALVEGDALLSTALYRYRDLETAEWERLAAIVMQSELPDYGEALNAVAAWIKLRRFPYWEGHRFISALFQHGGWEAVNNAYINSPHSTAEIIHPELYLQGKPPARVIVPDISSALPAGWQMVTQDTLGEFTVGLYLETVLPSEVAWRAVAGWNGDTFVVWANADGGRVLIWRTIWESTTEAAEFEAALGALIPQLYLPARPLAIPRGPVGQWWDTEAGAICLMRLGRYVTLVRAPDIRLLTDVSKALP
ncbi:MAG: hypothetical protein N2508_14050 [Anaerolineae bacterium]|nr:hypothetical protein [Anaerolineae bacterium]